MLEEQKLSGIYSTRFILLREQRTIYKRDKQRFNNDLYMFRRVWLHENTEVFFNLL